MGMKLVVSIVHGDDVDQLTAALRQKGFSSTKISTTGGFLREGNATILVGTEEQEVQAVLEINEGPLSPDLLTQFLTG